MRGAECWTDHNLIRSKMKLVIRPPTRKCAPKMRLNVNSLSDPTKRLELQNNLREALRNVPDPLDMDDITHEQLNGLWDSTLSILNDVAKTTLGTTTKKNPDWFDESAHIIKPLLQEKNRAHDAYLSNPSSRHLFIRWKNLRTEAQRKLREIQNTWWKQKAKEIQNYADNNKTYEFYDSIKGIFGPSKKMMTPVRSADGRHLIKNEDEILQRWAEHFRELLNHINPIDPTVLQELPDLTPAAQLDEPPSFQEVFQAVKCLKNKKAPGEDCIPAEIYKYGGPELTSFLHAFFKACWEQKHIPNRWKHSNIVTIYKKKGDRSICGNSRGISLLDVAGKILARILLRRLIDHISETILPESQCGFRPDRSTLDMIFVARLLIEKSREKQKEISFAFIDLAKAFDTVNRDLLWKILRKFGCPPTFVEIIRKFHEGMQARVSVGGHTSELFNVQVGVKQGCVLASVLFNLYLVTVTLLSRKDFEPDDGVRVRTRFDGSLFNTQRLKAKTRTTSHLLFELQYADDAATISQQAHSLQKNLTSLHKNYKKLGLTINPSKTKVLQTSFVTQGPKEQLHIDNAPLENSSSFTYLGSTIKDNGSIDEEIHHRIHRASTAFGRLRTRVFLNKNLRLRTKIVVFRAIVLSTLLYGCECWTPYRKHIKKLETFQIRCLQKILRITWKDRIPHSEILLRAETSSVEALINHRVLRWTGHVIRMADNRLPKITLFSELENGSRPHGCPKRRYRDHLRDVLNSCGIPTDTLEEKAYNRPTWRALCHQGVAKFEDNRRLNLEEKRHQRHQRRLNPPSTQTIGFPCPHCPRILKARIGLYSHLKHRH